MKKTLMLSLLTALSFTNAHATNTHTTMDMSLDSDIIGYYGTESYSSAITSMGIIGRGYKNLYVGYEKESEGDDTTTFLSAKYRLLLGKVETIGTISYIERASGAAKVNGTGYKVNFIREYAFGKKTILTPFFVAGGYNLSNESTTFSAGEIGGGVKLSIKMKKGMVYVAYAASAMIGYKKLPSEAAVVEGKSMSSVGYILPVTENLSIDFKGSLANIQQTKTVTTASLDLINKYSSSGVQLYIGARYNF